MSNFKPNYFQRRSKPQGPKANERIRALDVQVIGSDGNNLGTMELKKAIELAKHENLDLIEISPNANPPVCKIMDMGKYKYDLQKKANLAKKKQKIVSLKEIKNKTVSVRKLGSEKQETVKREILIKNMIRENKLPLN